MGGGVNNLNNFSMNKGLFAHLVATFIYCLCVMYVVGIEDTNMIDRAIIITIYFFINWFVLLFAFDSGWYKQRI